MDAALRTKIIAKLTKFLNRAPKEHEIINGETDATLMSWIARDEATQDKAKIAALETEVTKLKEKIK